MAKFKINIPVRYFRREDADALCAFFSGTSISWNFCKKETFFYVTSNVIEKQGNTYAHEIIGIQRLLKILPDDDTLKADLIKYKEEAKNDKLYDVTISFEGEIAAEIDISNNSILYYTGPIFDKVTYRDIPKLKKMITSDLLDDFYEEKVKKFLLCIMMAIVLSEPGIRLGSGYVVLYIDEQKYRKETLLESPIHTDAFKEYGKIMQTKLNFLDTFNWIKSYTKLQEDGQKPPIPFTMLTYLFNRDSHESLLYSVIGLENLFSKNDKGISYTLQNRINYLFPSITIEQIKYIYQQRSNFVHGKIKMNLYNDYSYTSNEDFQFDDAAILACALLMETIRLLVKNNATKISFSEQLSHKFI
jgi:hypothetical protein